MLIYYDKRRLNAALCIFKKTPEQVLLFLFCKRDLRTSNLQVFGDKSIGVSFIQIAQTARELLTCFDPPTQRGQTIGLASKRVAWLASFLLHTAQRCTRIRTSDPCAHVLGLRGAAMYA